jgi:hypothetical protein
MNMDIESVRGSIGEVGRKLLINSEGLVNLKAASGIYVEEILGDLNMGTGLSTVGSIDLLVPGGNATIGYISAPEGIEVVVGGNILNIGIIDPKTVNLVVLGNQGQVGVEKIYASESVGVSAENISLQNVIHTGTGNPLVFHVTGPDGGTAETVNVVSGSPYGIFFDQMVANNVSVRGETPDLKFGSALIGSRAVLTDGRTEVVVDRSAAALVGGDVQLLAAAGPFYLNFNGGGQVSTSALVVRFGEGVVVNGLTYRNGIARSADRLLIVAEPLNDEPWILTSSWAELLKEGRDRSLVVIGPGSGAVETDGEGVLQGVDDIDVIRD